MIARSPLVATVKVKVLLLPWQFEMTHTAFISGHFFLICSDIIIVFTSTFTRALRTPESGSQVTALAKVIVEMNQKINHRKSGKSNKYLHLESHKHWKKPVN
jgi:hypothetical protein